MEYAEIDTLNAFRETNITLHITQIGIDKYSIKMKLIPYGICILSVMTSGTAFMQNSSREIQLGSDSPIINSDDLISVLVQALQKDKASAVFRISWSKSLGGGSDCGTCLYDRKHSVLRYYDMTGYMYDVGWRPESRMYYTFTKVTDTKLLRIADYADAIKCKPHILPSLLKQLKCSTQAKKFIVYKRPPK